MVMHGITRRSRGTFCVAASVLLSLLCGPALALDAEFEIVSDQKQAGDEFCMAVDRNKLLVPDRGAQVVPPVTGAKPLPLSGTFYPVVAVACKSLDASFPSKWTFGDTHDLRIMVNGTPMCLSARFMTSFEPLLDPFLKAFHAFDQDSVFAYLAADLKPGGKANAARLHATPDLVASTCGRTDAADFWNYDDLNGTISSPSGWDDKSSRPHECVVLHGDSSSRPPKYGTGMPVTVTPCPDLRAYNRSGPADRRWRITAGKDALPTYPAAQSGIYFNGTGGLPIVGPLGRCLTAALPLKAAATSDCDGRVEQDWRINGDTIQLGPKGDCLSEAPDHAVMLSPCANAANQKWSYVVRDPVPNPRWRNTDVFGQMHPKDNPDQCMAVAEDPFADPMRQRNPVTPDRNNNESYWGCMLGRTHNAFSPLQLGKINWVLQNQLNRYPLVACQPVRNYDADHLECENAESLGLCRQTADYLKTKANTAMECVLGGRFARVIAAELQYPAVLHLLHNTPAGRALMNKLAGLPPRDVPPPPAAFDAVIEALKASKNLPLTMAIVNRVRELQDKVAQRNPSLAKTGFAANAGPLAVGDQQTVGSFSAQVFTQAFIENVPTLVSP